MALPPSTLFSIFPPIAPFSPALKKAQALDSGAQMKLSAPPTLSLHSVLGGRETTREGHKVPNRSVKKAKGLYCHSCGNSCLAGDTFCSACGSALLRKLPLSTAPHLSEHGWHNSGEDTNEKLPETRRIMLDAMLHPQSAGENSTDSLKLSVEDTLRMDRDSLRIYEDLSKPESLRICEEAMQLQRIIEQELTKVEPTVESAARADRCLQELNSIVRQLGPEWDVQPFGSFANGFGTVSSDLDITCCQAGHIPGSDTQSQSVFALDVIARVLHRHDSFTIEEQILGARVPILKLRFEDHLDIDLSCHNTIPLWNTRLLRAYSRMHRQVHDVGLAIKLWAKRVGICDAKMSKLSSYSFTLLVIYFLQVHHEIKLPVLPTEAFTDHGFEKEDSRVTAAMTSSWCGLNLVQLMSRFFTFYCHDFRWGHEVVSVRSGVRRAKHDDYFQQLRGRRVERLHIEDPYQLERNLNCVLSDYEEEQLRKLFLHALNQMQIFRPPAELISMPELISVPECAKLLESSPEATQTILERTPETTPEPNESNDCVRKLLRQYGNAPHEQIGGTIQENCSSSTTSGSIAHALESDDEYVVNGVESADEMSKVQWLDRCSSSPQPQRAQKVETALDWLAVAAQHILEDAESSTCGSIVHECSNDSVAGGDGRVEVQLSDYFDSQCSSQHQKQHKRMSAFEWLREEIQSEGKRSPLDWLDQEHQFERKLASDMQPPLEGPAYSPSDCFISPSDWLGEEPKPALKLSSPSAWLGAEPELKEKCKSKFGEKPEGTSKTLGVIHSLQKEGTETEAKNASRSAQGVTNWFLYAEAEPSVRLQ